MAKVVVVNSSPIIAFGKIGRLEILSKLFSNIHISEQVYKEIIFKPNYAETIAVKKAVEEDNWVKVHKSREVTNLLGVGESSSLGLALKLKQPLIIDDKKAVFIANTLGIECHGTLYVILLALKKKIIMNKKEAIDVVNHLISNKLYLSSDVLSEFYAMLEKIKV
ncbi:hypothetical protein J4448_02400 [Candidatus Woesearchaeota archaeon]|nr:hypothetical protein [Candidatus Woesearchaeota archaeon]